MELTYGDLLIMRVKEVTGEKPYTFMLRRDDGALCESDACDNENSKQGIIKEDNSEQVWDAVDLSETALLEIHIPACRIIVKSSTNVSSPQRGKDSSSFRNIILEPCIESISKLLALTVDHIDTLLEDWYPSIGTRFVHTSEGKYLVTRLIPCPRCLPSETTISTDPHADHGLVPQDNDKTWPSTSAGTPRPDIFKMFGFGIGNKSPRMSSDSGVGNSPSNTRVSSVDSSIDVREKEQEETMPGGILLKTGNRVDGTGIGRESFTSGLNYFLRGSNGSDRKQVAMYSWSVEYCILHGQKSFEFDASSTEDPSGTGDESNGGVDTFGVKCPKHGEILLKDIAPDILFFDLNSRYLMNNTDLQRNKLIGKVLI